LWTLVSAVLILTLIALKEYEGTACTAAVFLVGLALMLYDGSESYLKSYLESFPKE
jgi:amino acid permease